MKEIIRKRCKYYGRQILILFIGSLFYAFGYKAFIEPSYLILGGATGAATLFHGLFGLPVGVGIVLVNLPLFLWGSARRGIFAMLRTGLGILFTSIFLDVPFLSPKYTLPPALGAAFGGALTAVGIAMLLWHGYTTGGSELAAVLIRERFSLLTVGKIVLLIDTAIVLLSVFLLNQTGELFYSVLLNLVFAVALDILVSPKVSEIKQGLG
jgi:uncharacterized membrane-anchored protein YitT (DUF2179 family)